MDATITSRSVLTAAGIRLPYVGLGTWLAPPDDTEKAVDAALAAGYRHIDTAYAYENEAAIGNVIKKWLDAGKIKREELFVVTKLPNNAMRDDLVEDFLKQSLASLQLAYVDLYLIHMPVGLQPGIGIRPRNEDGTFKLDMTTDILAVWKAMEKQVDSGRAKTIGVSNFNIGQLKRIKKIARIPPVNNQVELHVYLQQKDLQKYCKENRINITSYATLGSSGLPSFGKNFGTTFEGEKSLSPMQDPVVVRIAKSHNKTAGQVLLRHLIQSGINVIPKSVTPARIEQNFQLFDFELTNKEMAELNALDKGEEGRKFAADLLKGMDKHPEYMFPK
uniref:NADP-dependent oxidoreductase domain-containing protein n=2 Tax=Graphocephala atropunctata TaxID=36148 RepID=A0A1B6MDY2_9HEMI